MDSDSPSCLEAGIRLQLGDTDEAERLVEDALPLMDAEGAPRVAARLYGVLAQALQQNGKFARAESLAMAALNEQAQGTTDFEAMARTRAGGLLQLSLIRLDLNKFDSALDDAEKALALYSERGAPSGDDFARVNYRRGRARWGLAVTAKPSRPCPLPTLTGSKPLPQAKRRCSRPTGTGRRLSPMERLHAVVGWWPWLRQRWPRRLIP